MTGDRFAGPEVLRSRASSGSAIAAGSAIAGVPVASTPMPSSPSKDLVAVDNPHPGRDYEVQFSTPELTCVCPLTGQPDFATVSITFVPDQHLVELKSLKLYLWTYRDVGAFHEDVTNRILDDLVAAISPRRMTVHTLWNVRGGITAEVTASHP